MHRLSGDPGPHNPNLGHAVGMAGGQNAYNISSHNYDRLEEGMIFVPHTQWLERMSAGWNIGDLCLVTADGIENLSRHTPLETHRVARLTPRSRKVAHGTRTRRRTRCREGQ